jgi:hypothetical protein
MRTLALSRPARVVSDEAALTAEYQSARYIHHRLLDFEDEHQRVLDIAQEDAAPGITRVSEIVSRLRRRQRIAKRATRWVPGHHPLWMASLSEQLAALRKTRNASPGWRAAIKWADEQTGDAKSVRRRRAKRPSQVRRRKTETEEAFAKRFALLTTDETNEHFAAKVAAAPRRTRREQYRAELYARHVGDEATERSRIYWGTWNALVKSVDQARAAVLNARRDGMPAEWHRPKWRDTSSLHADSGFRVVRRGGDPFRGKGGDVVNDQWWEVEIRLHSGWVRVRAKIGTWHELPESARLKACKLTRRNVAGRWRYSLSIVIDGMPEELTYAVGATPNQRGRRELLDGQGLVALDWGHREHGHPGATQGIRAFTWRGDDGMTGEILLPTECRRLLDDIASMKSRVDTVFGKRGVADRNRHTYRRRLMRQGVRTDEESLWLRWEHRYEQRMARARRRISALREQTYLSALRDLRIRYSYFAIEDEPGNHHRNLDTAEQTRHRKRENRDLVARYEFITICERLGGILVPVTARNTTRNFECCGVLAENTPELLMACPSCGRVVDKDHHATEEILRRGKAAIAEREAAE